VIREIRSAVGEEVILKTGFRLLLAVAAAVTVTTSCSKAPVPNTVLSADGTPISFAVRGAGEPALVFVHGWSGDRSGWRYQTEVFSKEHTVVTLDLAGFGASGNQRESWTVQRFAEDVAAVVESLDIEQAVLVGHSMGSGVILEAALLMPERVVGLIPVDVFQNVEDSLTDEEIDKREERLMNNVEHPNREYLESAFNNRLDPAVIDEIIAGYESSPKIGWGESLREFMVWRTHDLTGALSRLQVPIVCINSGRRVTEVEIARRYAPSFEVKVIDGVNHAIMLEAPEQFNTTLQQILVEHGWAPESTVLSKVQAFADAFRDGDVETIQGLLGSNYSHCNSNGSRPTREEWLAWFTTRAADTRAGRFVYTEYHNEDVRIQIHDAVAVVTAVNAAAGTREGAPFSHRLRFTQVWFLEEGEWKRIAFHDSRVLDD
jgi:pimeloyl-ACP methyl ester carboxylesterase